MQETRKHRSLPASLYGVAALQLAIVSLFSLVAAIQKLAGI